MHLSKENRESLLRYSQRLLDELSEHSRDSLQQQSFRMLQQLGRRADVLHAHLLVVRKVGPSGPSLSLSAEWSRGERQEIGSRLQNVPLSCFGSDAAAALSSGTIVFTSLAEQTSACSKMVSGMLRELELSAYEMIPVIIRNRLTAIIGLAHDSGPDHLDDEWRLLIQLIGKLLVQGFRSTRRERRSRREQRQWKSVVNGACDFALRVDADREIVATVAFRQKKIPQVKGLLLQEFVAAASRESLLEIIHASVQAGVPRSTEFLAIDANGRPCSYAARIEPSAGIGKGILTLYLTNNDIERAHAEELIGLREQLDRATRLSLLGHIATEFAHQLTQPLQAVANNLYTLNCRIRSDESSQAQLLDMAGKIENNVNHASDIIKSLRDFVRDRRMKSSPVCLRKMIDHAVSMVQLPAERVGVRITVLDPDGLMDAAEKAMVFVDRVQTTHVIINLLVNAIEASAVAKVSNPEIMILVKPALSSEHIVVEVADNGPGVPPDKTDSVFERFFTTKADGFGIGLAICRDVIERQGGSIRVRNNPDRGCTFFFSVPRFFEAEAADGDRELESDDE